MPRQFAADCLQSFASAGGSVLRVCGEQSHQQLVPGGWQPRVQRRGQRGRPLPDALDGVHPEPKRRDPGPGLVERGAKREQIACLAPFTQKGFRGDESQRARDLRSGSQVLRKSEVDQDRSPGFIAADVGRTDITMQDSLAMQVRQGICSDSAASANRLKRSAGIAQASDSSSV